MPTHTYKPEDYDAPDCIWGNYCDTALNISGWIDELETEPNGKLIPYCQMFDKKLRKDLKKKTANDNYAVRRCAECRKLWPNME